MSEPTRSRHRSLRLARVVALLVAGLGIGSATARAQVLYGSVVGVVKDAQGASIPGATVTATCVKGCKRTSLKFTNVAGTVSLKPFFARRAKQGTLKVGTKIRVAVTAPNMIGAVKTLTVRARRAPTVATRCLPPGAAAETVCAA